GAVCGAVAPVVPEDRRRSRGSSGAPLDAVAAGLKGRAAASATPPAAMPGAQDRRRYRIVIRCSARYPVPSRFEVSSRLQVPRPRGYPGGSRTVVVAPVVPPVLEFGHEPAVGLLLGRLRGTGSLRGLGALGP